MATTVNPLVRRVATLAARRTRRTRRRMVKNVMELETKRMSSFADKGQLLDVAPCVRAKRKIDAVQQGKGQQDW